MKINEKIMEVRTQQKTKEKQQKISRNSNINC